MKTQSLDLFATSEPVECITLNSCQSLALRRLIDAFKADDGLYSSCPDVVRAAFSDFYMPPYSSAEKQIAALQDESESRMRLIDKFAGRIRELETKLNGRASSISSHHSNTEAH
jgi:hypothetical protein